MSQFTVQRKVENVFYTKVRVRRTCAILKYVNIWTLERCDRTFCKDNEKRCIIQVGGHIDEVFGGKLGTNAHFDNPKPYTVRFSPFVFQYAITDQNTIDSKLKIGLIRTSESDKNRPGLVFGAVSLIWKALWSIVISSSVSISWNLVCWSLERTSFMFLVEQDGMATF